MHTSVDVESLKVHAEQELDTLEVICHIPDREALAQMIDGLRALPEVRAVHTHLHSIDKENLMTKRKNDARTQ